MVELRPLRPQERQGLLRLSRKAARRRSGRASPISSPVGHRRPAADLVDELKKRLLYRQARRGRALLGEGVLDDRRDGRCRRDPGLGLRALDRRPDQPDRPGRHREVRRETATPGRETTATASTRRSCCATWPPRARPSTAAPRPRPRRNRLPPSAGPALASARPRGTCHDHRFAVHIA